MNIPRAEHPNPQWERDTWKNLNGPWEFEFDFGCSAVERRLWEKKRFDREILVPFCPESRLSGIGYTDFISGVAYRRNFELSQEELSGRVLLHFGAVDYEASVYVNGTLVGSHKGGYTSFCFDITKHVAPGPNTLFVAVKDDVRSGLQPKGKQAHLYASSGCDYTRTTGIWQTVWLEFVPERHIQSAKYYPDPANGKVTVTGLVQGQGTLQLTTLWEDKPVGEAALSVEDGFFTAQLDLSETHLWEPGKGGLYTLLLLRRGPSKELFRPAHRQVPGPEVPSKRQVPIPAVCAGPGLLSRRHLHRPHGRGPGEGHPAVLCRGLQWRPAPREGL